MNRQSMSPNLLSFINQYIEEKISNEQVARILRPIKLMIDEGKFDRNIIYYIYMKFPWKNNGI
jgi:hypothetical protein